MKRRLTSIHESNSDNNQITAVSYSDAVSLAHLDTCRGTSSIDTMSSKRERPRDVDKDGGRDDDSYSGEKPPTGSTALDIEEHMKLRKKRRASSTLQESKVSTSILCHYQQPS